MESGGGLRGQKKYFFIGFKSFFENRKSFFEKWKEFLDLLIICGLIALVHIASYAPRSGLRAAGQAKLEAGTKVLERTVTVTGYLILYHQGSSSVSSYALVFLLGAIIGLIAALGLSYSILKPISNGKNSVLSDSWLDNKTLLLQALPFAVTLGVYASQYSGAHINPAVTFGLLSSGDIELTKAFEYLIGQSIGAFLACVIIYLHYLPHWSKTNDKKVKLGVFATSPSISSRWANLNSEILGTFALLFGLKFLQILYIAFSAVFLKTLNPTCLAEIVNP